MVTKYRPRASNSTDKNMRNYIEPLKLALAFSKVNFIIWKVGVNNA